MFDIWLDMNTGNTRLSSYLNDFDFNSYKTLNRVGIEHTMGESQNAYLAATTVKAPPTIREEPAAVQPMAGAAHSDTDSDSN